MSKKRKLSLALSIVAFFCMLFGSYAVSAVASSATTSAQVRTKGRIHITTATSGGTYYACGLALSQLLQEEAKVQASAATSAGSIENVTILTNREATMGCVQSDILVDSYYGLGSFEGKSYPDLRILVPIIAQQYHMLVRSDANINSIADWKGKRVVVGRAGSGSVLTTERIIKNFGLTLDDLAQNHLDFATGVDAMRNGMVDVIIVTSAAPVSTVADAVSTSGGKIKLYEVTEEEAEAILMRNSYMVRNDIVGGSYSGYDKDIRAIGHIGYLVVNDDMTEDLAYDIVKLMYNKAEKLFTMASSYNNTAFNYPQYYIDSIKVPLHPGAEKALRELGLYK